MSKQYRITEQPQEVQAQIWAAMNDINEKLDYRPSSDEMFYGAIEWSMNNLAPDFSIELDRLIERWEGERASHMELERDAVIGSLKIFHREEWGRCNVVLSVLRELKESGKKPVVMCEVCKLPTDGVNCYYKRCPVEGGTKNETPKG